MGSEKLQQGFGPLPERFIKLPYNDVNAVRKNINQDTIAVFVEAVQGEGGVIPGTQDFMENLREICTKNDVLLIFDEIQTGFGRTGNRWWGIQQTNVNPDVITIAKGFGSGIPIGGFLTRPEYAAEYTTTDSFTTFGVNPLSCAAAVAVIEIIQEENYLSKAAKLGASIKKQLLKKQEKCKTQFLFYERCILNNNIERKISNGTTNQYF